MSTHHCPSCQCPGRPGRALLVALKACADLVTNAVDQKLCTGRLPPIGALLSTIKDTARAAIIKTREEESSHE